VAASIGRDKAPRILAGLVVVFGLVQAISMMNTGHDPRPTVRPADTSNIVAMNNARQPTWVLFANPIVGAIGVMIGAGWRKR
jgi:hypothetical protein